VAGTSRHIPHLNDPPRSTACLQRAGSPPAMVARSIDDTMPPRRQDIGRRRHDDRDPGRPRGGPVVLAWLQLAHLGQVVRVAGRQLDPRDQNAQAELGYVLGLKARQAAPAK